MNNLKQKLQKFICYLKSISKKNIIRITNNFSCYLYLIGTIAFFFLIQPILTPYIVIINDKWLSHCAESWYAFIIISVALIISFHLIYKKKKYNLFVAHKDVACATFVMIIYIYYRFYNNIFDFFPKGVWSYTDVLFIPYITLLIVKLNYKGFESPNSVTYILNDRPINNEVDDILNTNNIVNSLYNDLCTVDVRNHSYSIGISGAWGLGKSSFLNLFEKKVLADKNIVIRFYPRSSNNIDDIQKDFFECLMIELSKFHTGFKCIIRKYANALQINAGESWLSRVINTFITLNAFEERKSINNAINVVGRKIFVIIEDLDRLTAREILEVLKLIDKNGDFCNTIFITAYDKEYINSVLEKDIKHKSSQCFTDKYFNYELPLSVQSFNTLSIYFKEYIKNHLIVKNEDAVTQYMIISAFEKNLSCYMKYLRTIRNVKRFINIFMLRYPRVKNDVNINDFFLLTLLRYKDLNVYYLIANGDLITKGNFPEGNKTVFYLCENYYQLLKSNSTWDGCEEILRKLFPDKGTSVSIYDNYNRIRSICHFDLYFYDYKVGNVYYVDLMQLFKVTEDDKAFALVDKMLQNIQQQQLEQFLRSRTMNWISNKNTLIRLFVLLVYFNIDNNLNIQSTILWLLKRDTIFDAIQSRVVRNDKEYIDAIYEAINKIIGFRPFQFGYLIIEIINNLVGENRNDFTLIFNHQKLTNIAELCQKSYYAQFGLDDRSCIRALYLCKIIGPKDNNLYDYNARVELYSLMKKYSDDFAKTIIYHEVLGRNLILKFIQEFDVKKIFPVDGEHFRDWQTTLNDKDAKLVLNQIYISILNNQEIKVPALKNSYSRIDMKAFSEAILADVKIKHKDKILSECKSKFIVDLTMLSQNTNININHLKKYLDELVKLGQLPERFGHLKRAIESLQVGDYVKIKDSLYNKLVETKLYNNNIFKIIALDAKHIELHGISKNIRISDVEPIPIDRVADKNIYYNPIVMGSYVAPGQSAPIYEIDYSYYIDHMKYCREVDNITFYEKIRQRDCQYVHEVQHYLREKFREDRLFIKNNLSFDRLE